MYDLKPTEKGRSIKILKMAICAKGDRHRNSPSLFPETCTV